MAGKSWVDDVEDYLHAVEDVEYKVDQMLCFVAEGDVDWAKYIWNEMSDWEKEVSMLSVLESLALTIEWCEEDED